MQESACNAGDLGSIPGFERSPGEGNGNPLQYSCLEKPTDIGAWQAIVHGVGRVGHDLETKPLYIYMCVCIYIYTHTPRRRAWQPTPVFTLGSIIKATQGEHEIIVAAKFMKR